MNKFHLKKNIFFNWTKVRKGYFNSSHDLKVVAIKSTIINGFSPNLFFGFINNDIK